MRIQITPGVCEMARLAPVHAPKETWRTLPNYKINHRYVIEEGAPTKICGIAFQPFSVEHSILAPAVGYRISAGRARIFYGADLLFIHNRAAALKDVQIYIGDGATITRSFVRRRGDRLIGHANVRTQLGWCAKEGVLLVIITHCGSEIVTGKETQLAKELQKIAADRGIEAFIARDGMMLDLSPGTLVSSASRD